MDITNGKGADRVLQCATTDSAIHLGLGIMGSNSVLAVEGFGSKTMIPVDFGSFIIKPMSIVGVRGATHRSFTETVAAAEAGEIQVEPLITHRFKLDDIQKAFDTLLDKTQKAIKIVINP